jgi:hypothetical protein
VLRTIESQIVERWLNRRRSLGKTTKEKGDNQGHHPKGLNASDANVSESTLSYSKALSRSVSQVDDSSTNERSPVVNANVGNKTVVAIDNSHPRPEGEVGVSSSHCPRTVGLAVGSFVSVQSWTVPAGLTALLGLSGGSGKKSGSEEE